MAAVLAVLAALAAAVSAQYVLGVDGVFLSDLIFVVANKLIVGQNALNQAEKR